MRKVTVRPLQEASKSVLLSLNRFFYVLRPLEENSDLRSSPVSQGLGYKIVSKIEREAT